MQQNKTIPNRAHYEYENYNKEHNNCAIGISIIYEISIHKKNRGDRSSNTKM